ncbi:MAG: DUF3616 domain-containing protein [Verrucomicrobia bacterium]|nr:DUF3616 domain-containing protein [Verrucomicrobiota bacterium]
MTAIPRPCRDLILGFAALIPWFAHANAAEGWALQGRGERWIVEGKIRKGDNVSGAAILSGDAGYLVSDETRAVQPFRLDAAIRTLRVGEPLNLLPGAKPELDLEAIAAAPQDSCYYTAGSHSVARKSGAAGPDRAWVFRLPVDSRTREIQRDKIARATLRPLIAADPVLTGALDRPASEGGLDIEGLAEKNGTLYFGLRAPTRDGHAFILEINARDLFSGNAPALRRHELPLGGGRGVRDLATVRDGFLLIAGASMSGDDATPAAHGFALYFWPGPGHTPVNVGDITTPAGGKAEGLLVWAESDISISVLLLFDGADNGAPTQVFVQKPRAEEKIPGGKR